MLPRIAPRSLRTYSSFASTSKFTLDSPMPSFELLAERAISSRPTKGRRSKRNNPAFFAQLKQDQSLVDDSLPMHLESYSRAFSPYLALTTRERNYLVSKLRRKLYTKSPDPNEVWESLVGVLQYPAIRPNLPFSRPTLINSTKVDNLDNGEELEDTRRAIPLSLVEIRRSFTILASVRPPTRSTLNKLLVLTELLTMRSSVVLSTETGGNLEKSRDEEIGILRGGGIGLRPTDWHSLLLFSSSCFRSVRQIPEVSSAISIFSQWTKNQTSPNGQSLKPGIETYNTFLKLSVDAGNWILFDSIQERMKSEGLKEDLWSFRIQLSKEEKQGVNIEIIWETFLKANRLLLMKPLTKKVEEGMIGLWNEMIWIYSKRSYFEEAKKIYQVLGSNEEINLHELGPIKEGLESRRPLPFLCMPPSRDIISYTSLIQTFSHQGNFLEALRILRDLSINESKPNSHMFMCLFRGFATHGIPSTKSNHLSINRLSLSGDRVGPNKLGTTSLSQLSLPAMVELTIEERQFWSLENLEAILPSFFELKVSSTGNKVNCPTSKQLFWLILALEKLSGDENKILRIWDQVERNFGESIGWRIDSRIERKIKTVRETLIQKEQQRNLNN